MQFFNNLHLFIILSWLLISCDSRQPEYDSVRFGICTDVHKDIMHDADERLAAFIDEAKTRDLDFIIQMGDFARPYEHNKEFMAIWNSYPGEKYHVLGNHEPDGGFDMSNVVENFGMPSRYYSFDKGGLRFIVLDGNEFNPSPDRPGGYSRYISEEQLNWMVEELRGAKDRVVIISHQSLEHEEGIENREYIRSLLEEENRLAGYDKIIACFSGHHHTDYATTINGIYYIQINSMSYYWAGDNYKVIRYSEDIDQQFPWIKYTIPYEKPLYTFVEISKKAISIEGKETKFVGPGPEVLGMPTPPENNPIVPRISNRKLLLKP
ncbi:MAG: metallophosphoesterase family protein [Cecembia sp.]